MEKENINPQESSNFSKSPISILREGYTGVGKGELLNHNHSLEELFKSQIQYGINCLKETGAMMPAAFLVCRDYDENQYKIGIYPMLNPFPGAMGFHSTVLRKLIKEMKAAEMSTFKLVGVIRSMDAHMIVKDKEEILDENGDIDKAKFKGIKNDKDAKDCLHFELEDKFSKHTIIYEYIKSTDGSIVVNSEPLADVKTPYDEKMDKNCNFGYLFAEGVGQN